MGKLIYPWLFQFNQSVEDKDNQGYVLNYLKRNRMGKNDIYFLRRNQRGY